MTSAPMGPGVYPEEHPSEGPPGGGVLQWPGLLWMTILALIPADDICEHPVLNKTPRSKSPSRLTIKLTIFDR